MSPAETEDLPLGSVIGGRYRLERLIGSGGMGTVYAARELAPDRSVALKFISRNHTTDPTMVARFQREGRVVSALRHPNIVEVFELGEVDGEWVMAMELLSGMNLGDAIAARTTFTPAEAVPVLRAVLDALQVAHDHQIVHRDIKPQNIFLGHPGDGTGFVKVLDFGVAKEIGLSAQEQLTRSGTMLGTPEFMAPEQANASSVDHRSDLYSVACVAYAMLCGAPPFVDDWPLRIVMKHAFAQPVPPSRLRAELARCPGVDAFMARALQKRPADRFQSAADMRAALDAFADTPL